MLDRTTVILLGCIMLCIAIAPGVFAAGEYDITASDSVDTESRTVTVDGDEYEVESIGRTAVDTTVSVDIDAPDDEATEVYLYNKERDIVESRDSNGGDSVSIDMSGYDPGSYALALLDEENDIEDVQPLVVAGWDTTLSVNTTSEDEIEKGNPLSATVSISEHTEMPEPESVEIVFTKDDSVITRTDAANTGDGEYEATIDTDRDTGTYRIYANVRNTTTAEGRHEVVGVSNSHVVEIKSNISESDGDSDSTETESGTGGGGVGGQPTSTATATSTTSSTSNTSTTTQTTSTTTATPVTSSTTLTTSSSDQTTTSPVSVSTTERDDGVITAVSETVIPSSTPTSTPGFGILSTVIALAGSTLLLYRQ